MLEQYPISDLLTWLKEKTLVLNTQFQRRSVWPPAARAYLIDTVLRDRPMPKIYLRTKTDLKTRRSYREIVDGQQRLRAIQDFANGEFQLGTRKETFGENAGKSYEDLDDDAKTTFLSYAVPVHQLFNAPDSEVLDIFHRLNAYGLDVNPQELRHGKYQGAFRSAVAEASGRWSVLWDNFKIVGIRARVRMADDQLMAQMYGVVLRGVVDGSQPVLNELYKNYDGSLPPDTTEKVDKTVAYILTGLTEILETGLSGAPHFLMLFAAVSHAMDGIPDGQMGPDMPQRDPRALSDIQMAIANLGVLVDVLLTDVDDVLPRFRAFKFASAGSTQRIKSRSVRFQELYQALLSDPI